MKWTYSIRQKSTAALVLAFVFLLILGKNLLDKNNVSELGSSFSSVYEDRLLVESYIYQLSDHLYQKKIMVDNCSSQENLANLHQKLNQHNAEIQAIIVAYEKTKLTPDEQTYFSQFKQHVTSLNTLEGKYIGANTDTYKSEIDAEFKAASANLHQLSGIQISEGKLLNDRSKRIIAGSTLLTRFELAILIGIGLFIQALIFASRSVKPKKQQQFSLN